MSIQIRTPVPESRASFACMKQANAGELNIGYAEAGPPDGPAVLLLHGWPYDIHSLHRPDELDGELTEAGFGQTRVLAIEGPAWLLQDLDRQWEDPMLREILLEVVRRTEAEPSLLGASSHLLAVGRKIA